MGKKPYYRLFFALALVLAAVFCVSLTADAVSYDPTAYSAPFSVFALMRALEFLLPGLVSLCIAAVLRKKFRKSSGRRKWRGPSGRKQGS